ncbi:MAG TPA: hypothetical protein VM529_15895 [Gemmata sp.]|jgi:hypothetical protein|nr:hypothetical protein [Gemmata sp.]
MHLSLTTLSLIVFGTAIVCLMWGIFLGCKTERTGWVIRAHGRGQPNTAHFVDGLYYHVIPEGYFCNNYVPRVVCEDMQKDLKDRGHQLTETAVLLARSKEYNKQLTDEIAALREQHRGFLAASEKAAKRHQEELAKLTERVEFWKKEAEEKSKRIGKLNEDIDAAGNLRKTLSDACTARDKLRVEYNVLAAERDKAHSELSSARRLFDSLQSTFNELIAKIGEAGF